MSYKLLEATLNDVPFSAIGMDNELVLVDIIEEEAKMETQTVAVGLKNGMIRTVNRRESLSVKLEFCIRTQDVHRRADLRNAIAEWSCNGGKLEINSRPDKYLQVMCDTPVALGSSAKWTESITLTLTAYEVPYWQSNATKNLTFYMQTVDSGGYWIADVFNPEGTAGDVEVEAMIYHIGDEPLTYMKIICGKTFFEFDDMSVEPGAVIMIAYDNGILSVTDFTNVDEDNSLLKYRTAESSDDLMVTPYTENAVQIAADQRLRGQIKARGRWL